VAFSSELWSSAFDSQPDSNEIDHWKETLESYALFLKTPISTVAEMHRRCPDLSLVLKEIIDKCGRDSSEIDPNEEESADPHQALITQLKSGIDLKLYTVVDQDSLSQPEFLTVEGFEISIDASRADPQVANPLGLKDTYALGLPYVIPPLRPSTPFQFDGELYSVNLRQTADSGDFQTDCTLDNSSEEDFCRRFAPALADALRVVNLFLEEKQHRGQAPVLPE